MAGPPSARIPLHVTILPVLGIVLARHTALPMEPRGLLAEWDAARGRMTVLGAAKVPFFNRDTMAAMLGLSPAQVDLIENDVGGGFGARGEFYPEDFLIPFAARDVGRPVRWIEDRREHRTAMNHARQADCEVEIACRSSARSSSSAPMD